MNNKKELLHMYIVYYNPSDFPSKFVVKHVATDHEIHTFERYVEDTYESVIKHIPEGLIRLERHESDAKPILEVWL